MKDFRGFEKKGYEYRTIVHTEYHGPSNTRGSYISVKWGSTGFSSHVARLTKRFPYNDELDSDGNHLAAARVILGEGCLLKADDGKSGYYWMPLKEKNRVRF